MALHESTKGLDLPIEGAPIHAIRGERFPTRVAVMADDFPSMRPAMHVAEGDTVKRGEVLFEDRKRPGVLHTAPGAGRVIGVNRGAKRALQSVVIELSEAERGGDETVDAELQSFAAHTGDAPASLSRDQVVALLIESGQWTALRTRPFGRTPEVTDKPHSLFVTAMDSEPLAPLPEVVVERRREDFDLGLQVLRKLTDGATYLCVHVDSEIPNHVTADVTVEHFKGPHPAGTAGYHVHKVDPVSRTKTVWTVGYQDVIATGSLFRTGALDVSRVASIGGPAVTDPMLVHTRMGADIAELAGGIPEGVDVRLIAGSVLSGKAAQGDVFGYLGRFHNQLSVLREGRERVFLGWLTPGWNAFSSAPIYLSRLFRGKRFPMTTTTNGSPRSMVPIGMYERVMPMDIQPTYLLRALVVGDIEQAEKLGALELQEEDLALCSFVCPGKTDYGPLLRKNLEMIEKEG